MKFNLKLFYRITFWISLIGVIAIILEFGFTHKDVFKTFLNGFYFFVLGVELISIFSRYIRNRHLLKKRSIFFDIIGVGFILWLYYMYLFVGVPFEADLILTNPIWIKIAVLFTFIREFSELKINLKRAVLNPAQLFILSFLVIILIGSLLLILPNATYEGISYLDALFTSTSAVCVTGLAVVDTGTHFTLFGQTIIMILIQIGGLGILTFASYFSYFSKVVLHTKTN